VTAHIGMRTYVAVFLALLVLTGVTVAAAFIHMGVLNNIVALGIACTKATLVLLYFMHLRHSPALTRLCVVAAILFFLTLVSLTMSDVISRGWLAAAK
jgi:cytochrome c oxidase subunit 4